MKEAVYTRIKKLIAAGALTGMALFAPTAAQAGSPVPPRPEVCKRAGVCVLVCSLPFPPFGVSSNTAFCNRWNLPLFWVLNVPRR